MALIMGRGSPSPASRAAEVNRQQAVAASRALVASGSPSFTTKGMRRRSGDGQSKPRLHALVSRQDSEPKRRGSVASRFTRAMAGSNTQPRTAAAARLIAQRSRHTKRLTARERLFLILDEPTSSVLARLFAIMVRVVTLVSTTSAVIETCTDPNLMGGIVVQSRGLMAMSACMRTEWAGDAFLTPPRSPCSCRILISHLPLRALTRSALCARARVHHRFTAVRSFSGLFFTAEAVLRVACYIPLRRAFLDPFIWLDCLTPLPFLIQTVLRVQLPIMEAWSSIRLLKLCRYFESSALLAKAFQRSADQLLVPLFMLATMVVSCSSVRPRPHSSPAPRPLLARSSPAPRPLLARSSPALRPAEYSAPLPS